MTMELQDNIIFNFVLQVVTMFLFVFGFVLVRDGDVTIATNINEFIL